MPRPAPIRCLVALLACLATLFGAGLAAAAGATAQPVWPLVPGGPLDTTGLPGATGHGIVVAVVDSGVDLGHRDLHGAVWTNPREHRDGVDEDHNGYVDDVQGIDLVNPGTPPQDEGGHGTAIAGILAGRGWGPGRRGLAPLAMVLPVRVLDAHGNGQARDVAAGVDYAVGMGARVVVLSLGAATPDDTLTAALQRARDRDVLVVAAAGNTGGAPLYPAAQRDIGVLAVAATDHAGHVIAGSARGDLVPLGAPGAGVPALAIGGGTIRMTGTSFAAPWVGAAACALMSAWPQAGAATIRRALLSSAVRGAQPAGALTAGTLDVRRAWRSTRRSVRGVRQSNIR